jgi:uncharacterized alpha-E superfamily protein
MANSKRKCKPCGEYFRPGVTDREKRFCSPMCFDAFKKSANTKPKTKAKPKRPKLKSLPRLVEECAVTLQRLVRVKAADGWGFARCVTCSKADHFTNLQGGHFIERGKKSTKLIEENCHPQCQQCNAWKMKTTSGVLEYRNYMVATYGETFVNDLIAQSKLPKKYTRSEVEAIHNDYKARLDALEREL